MLNIRPCALTVLFVRTMSAGAPRAFPAPTVLHETLPPFPCLFLCLQLTHGVSRHGVSVWGDCAHSAYPPDS